MGRRSPRQGAVALAVELGTQRARHLTSIGPVPDARLRSTAVACVGTYPRSYAERWSQTVDRDHQAVVLAALNDTHSDNT